MRPKKSSPAKLESAMDECPTTRRAELKPYLVALAIITTCLLIGWGLYNIHFSETNILMLFLAGVGIVAARYSRGPTILAAVLSVFLFDFFFVAPPFTIDSSDIEYVITLFVVLALGISISNLTTRLRKQLSAAQHQEQETARLFLASQQQERRTAQLYQMTRQLSDIAGTDLVISKAGSHLREIFSGDVVIYLCQADGSLTLQFKSNEVEAAESRYLEVANWVAENEKPAGLATVYFSNATACFVPMVGTKRTFGVLGVRPSDARRFQDFEEQRMLETCANLIALSMERDQSLLEAQQAQVQVQSEQLRNSLLSSVSHDLRTPLAMIAVTASSLLENSTQQNWNSKRDMLQTVVDQSRRLSRQVDNLLEMARLDSGTVVLKCEWQVLEELVGVALTQLATELQDREVQVEIPDDFPMLWVAGNLLEQTLVNLLENAIRYTPPRSRIQISAVRANDRAEIIVADWGPGLPRGSEARVFEKFFRGPSAVADGRRGIGLGLTICQGIVQAHGGHIAAKNRPNGGAEFIVSLPCPEQSPQVTLEDSILTSNR